MRTAMRRLLASAAILFFILIAPATQAVARDLTFEERIKAQEAIERVYLSHQIGDARRIEEALPRRALETQVLTYLKRSAALEKFWKTRVTREMLLAEVHRMHIGSRMPDRLAELEHALNNDSLLIEECLARPILVERLIRNF